MEKAGAWQAESVIIVSNDTEYVRDVCLLSREHFQIPTVVADVVDMKMVPELLDMGVRVVQPAMATAMALEGALRFPTAFDMLINKEDDIELAETTLRNREYVGRPLRRIQLPGNAVIFSVKRDQTVMVPRGETILEYGDEIALLGHPGSLKDAVGLLSM